MLTTALMVRARGVMLAGVDETLRAHERAVLEAPGDEAAARAYLAALARVIDPGRDVPQAAVLEGKTVLGPLLPIEAERIRELEPGTLLMDAAGVGWIAGDEARGRALFAATLDLRILELERLAVDTRASFAAWSAIHAALDAGGARALERLAAIVASSSVQAADRIVRLLAARPEADVGRRLARLAKEVPVESRPRLYDALATGIVPLDGDARDSLRAAIARELPALRIRATKALFRGATKEDLERDRASGPPEVRAEAFKVLVARQRPTSAKAHDLVRHAIADGDAQVRCAAVHLFSKDPWARHPRAAEWAMSRLVDADRAVRVEAVKVLRKVQVPPRLLPRLQTIVAQAPPGLRPGLKRLLERIESKKKR